MTLPSLSLAVLPRDRTEPAWEGSLVRPDPVGGARVPVLAGGGIEAIAPEWVRESAARWGGRATGARKAAGAAVRARAAGRVSAEQLDLNLRPRRVSRAPSRRRTHSTAAIASPAARTRQNSSVREENFTASRFFIADAAALETPRISSHASTAVMGSDWGASRLPLASHCSRVALVPGNELRDWQVSAVAHSLSPADASSDEDTKKPATPLAPPIPAIVPKKGRFADEDLSDDDVKDSWDVSDDDDDDDSKAKKPAPVVGSMRNKGAVKQKIAAREQEEARKAEEAERLVRWPVSDSLARTRARDEPDLFVRRQPTETGE